MKTLLIVGAIILAYNYWPFDPPPSYTQIAEAKRESREAAIASRCARPGAIEVTVQSWHGLKTYQCNTRNSS
jgi:hypothetical protein